MTIVSSGAISINSLVGEYGGSAPHGMNEYYRGGSLVPSHSNTSGIPSSGTIQLDDFYGTSASAPNDNQFTFTAGSFTVPGAKFQDVRKGVQPGNMGSFSDSSFTNASGTTTFTVTEFFHTTTTLSTIATFSISGNHSGTLTNAIGYSHIVAFSQGSTVISDDPTQSNGVYITASNHTTWSVLRAQGTMPTSGSVTISIS